MTVQKELTKNIYVGNGQTTKFPFTFECPDNHPEYIRAYVNGKNNKLTETTNFSVDMTNKAITYPANGEPLAADEQLVIMRELPVRQLMNLVNNGPFFAEDIETAFDEGIMIAQQSSEKLGRALVAPPGSTTFDPQIPIVPGKTFRVSDDGTHLQATEDPGKVIDEAKRLFDETAANAETAKKSAEEIKKIYDSGGLTPITDLMGSIGTALKRWGYIFANKVFAMNLPIVYKSVAEMKADSLLSAGMTACTLGYYSPNDGGAGTYIIRAKAEGDVDDGGSLHELTNGNVAELVVENGTVNVKQFGAKGDGVTDDYRAIFNALNYSDSIYIPRGNFFCDGSFKIKNKQIRGESYDDDGSVILCNPANNYTVFLLVGINNIIEKIRIKRNKTFNEENERTFSCIGIDLGVKNTNEYAQFNVLRDVYIWGLDVGLMSSYAWIVQYYNVYCNNCNIGIHYKYGNAQAFYGLNAQSNKKGIIVDTASGLLLSNFCCEGNSEHYFVANGGTMTLTNVYFENTLVNDVGGGTFIEAKNANVIIQSGVYNAYPKFVFENCTVHAAHFLQQAGYVSVSSNKFMNVPLTKVATIHKIVNPCFKNVVKRIDFVNDDCDRSSVPVKYGKFTISSILGSLAFNKDIFPKYNFMTNVNGEDNGLRISFPASEIENLKATCLILDFEDLSNDWLYFRVDVNTDNGFKASSVYNLKRYLYDADACRVVGRKQLVANINDICNEEFDKYIELATTINLRISLFYKNGENQTLEIPYVNLKNMVFAYME